MTLADLPPTMLRVCAVLLGLVWGSFLNVVIHRLPRNMSIVRPASHCPACNKPIPVYRNIPVLSWLWARGRARCCGAKISPRYLVVEVLGAVISLAVLETLVFQLPGSAPLRTVLSIYIAHFALALGLVAACFIDLEYMLVPDSISIGGTVLGIATFSLRGMSLTDTLLGAVIGFAIVWLPFDVIYSRLRGAPGMGLGDAKLLMLAGAWFGWSGALFVLGAGAVQGVIATLLLLLVGKQPGEPEAVIKEREEIRRELENLPPEERGPLEAEFARDPLAAEPAEGLGKARIAFGPFLILAMLECLFIGVDNIFNYLLA